VVFFGFLYPSKGIELLFDIASPVSDFLIIAGAFKDKAYIRQLAGVAQAKGWREDQLHFTGFLSPQDAADLLTIPDAVVLPFLDGGGEWNTSIHSASAQGTLVITTAVPPRGDEPQRNLFTAAPSDICEMRAALDRLAGRRSTPTPVEAQWQGIATAHLDFYHQFTCSDVSKQA
jgi:glycosyltransferase involved in cell wall biosynthesis